MNDRHPLTVATAEDIHRLWCQGNLGYEHYDIFTVGYNLVYGAHYNLGFAASRHSE